MNDKLIKQKHHDSFRALFRDVKDLIESGRTRVAVTVNTALTLLYWQVGQRINKEILGHERAEYGKQILQTLSAKLTDAYGRGWRGSSSWQAWPKRMRTRARRQTRFICRDAPIR